MMDCRPDGRRKTGNKKGVPANDGSGKVNGGRRRKQTK